MSRQTFFKHDIAPLGVERRRRKLTREKREQQAMAAVRKRDKGCRFPRCRCRRVGIRLEVSHAEHRGMGGNPSGDRTDPATMVQVCAWRHTQGVFSIDKGTLRWVPMSVLGANGHIQWQIDIALFHYYMNGGERPATPKWMAIAEEAPGQLGVAVGLSEMQENLLTRLAAMQDF